MIATLPGGARLAGHPPEWEPWLRVVEETLREAAVPAWDAAAIPRLEPHEPGVPLLAGARVSIASGVVLRALQNLRAALPAERTAALGAVDAVLDCDDDGVGVFRASLEDDTATIERIARGHGVDLEALNSVASLLPVPFLQACHRRFGEQVDASRSKAYCPLCGSWPAFAEVIDVECVCYYRCGRCGSAWIARLLSCAFCGTTDHNNLVRLMPEDHARHGLVDACAGCSRYIKIFTALEACPPLEVMLRDLASVDLDFAALEQGYARPAATGYRLGLQATVI